MNTKNSLTIILLVVLTACSDNYQEKMIGFYPMKIGSSWNKIDTNYYTIYDSTGKIQKKYHTIEHQNTIIKKDTIVNGITLRQFVTTRFVQPKVIYDALYYRQDIEGLKEYGCSMYGGSWYLDQIVDSLSQSRRQSNPKQYKIKSNLSSNFYLYNKPYLEIQYPLSENSEWVCVTDSNYCVRKRVIGKDTLVIDEKKYPCYKIERFAPTVYEYYYEWISSYGLLKIESQSLKYDLVQGDNSYGQYMVQNKMIVQSFQLK